MQQEKELTHCVLKVEHIRHVGHEGVHPVPIHSCEASCACAHIHHVFSRLLGLILWSSFDVGRFLSVIWLFAFFDHRSGGTGLVGSCLWLT